jgi:hypothetical protein
MAMGSFQTLSQQDIMNRDARFKVQHYSKGGDKQRQGQAHRVEYHAK